MCAKSLKIVFVYGIFVSFVVIVSVNRSGAHPAGPWAAPLDLDVIQKIEDLTRIEREIDLRQNLHKHLKPFVAISSPHNLKRPKPVEKPVTPYFVRILKRRPGSSKESSEDESAENKDIPKVLIDRRRNKESPLPVVVVDENGIPLPTENETVSVERPNFFKGPNAIRTTEETQSPFQPIAEALKSETDTSPTPISTTSTTTLTTTTTTPTTTTTTSTTTSPTTTTVTTTIQPIILETTTSPAPTVSTTQTTTELTSTSQKAETTTTTTTTTTTEIPTTTTTSTTTEPSTTQSSTISSVEIPSEPPKTTITDQVSESTSPSPSIILPPVTFSTSPIPINSDVSSVVIQPTSFTTYPDDQYSSFEPVPATPQISNQTSTTLPDSRPSYSTLAVTTLLPNGEKPFPTISQQDDQSVQASEIFSQRVSPTTPISLTSVNNQLELTTLKPSTGEFQSPSSSNTLSSEQLQLLMKAALARLLLQGQGGSNGISSLGGNKLPEITIPQNVRLVENKPKQEDVVVFSPVSRSTVTNKPTSPMPNIINALQSLIAVTNSVPQRQQNTPRPAQSQSFTTLSSNNNNLFSPDGIFSRFFATTRAASNNIAVVRSSDKPTTAAPTFFINLRNQMTSQLPPQREVATSRYPILSTPAPTKTWEEFTGNRQNSQNTSPLRTLLMMPINVVMGMFKAAQQLGAFMGNAVSTLANMFNPNRNQIG